MSLRNTGSIHSCRFSRDTTCRVQPISQPPQSPSFLSRLALVGNLTISVFARRYSQEEQVILQANTLDTSHTISPTAPTTKCCLRGLAWHSQRLMADLYVVPGETPHQCREDMLRSALMNNRTKSTRSMCLHFPHRLLTIHPHLQPMHAP